MSTGEKDAIVPASAHQRLRDFVLSSNLPPTKLPILVMTALFLAAGSSALRAQEVASPDRAQDDLPAVDRFNFTLSGLAGSQGGWSNDMVLGTFAIPMFHSFGLQFDMGVGKYDSAYQSEAGAFHVFWRNPSRGMVGFYGDWAYVNPEHAGRVGFEGAYYFDRVTVDVLVGVHFGQHVYTRGFDEIDVAYYFTDNLKGSIGHRNTTRGDVANIGFEYVPARAPNWSIFGEAEFGEDDNHSAFAGLRYEFGPPPPSLLAGDRQAQVPTRIPRNIVDVTRCGELPESKPSTFWRSKMSTLCASKNELNREGAREGKI
jgi:hypothetical protein